MSPVPNKSGTVAIQKPQNSKGRGRRIKSSSLTLATYRVLEQPEILETGSKGKTYVNNTNKRKQKLALLWRWGNTNVDSTASDSSRGTLLVEIKPRTVLTTDYFLETGCSPRVSMNAVGSRQMGPLTSVPQTILKHSPVLSAIKAYSFRSLKLIFCFAQLGSGVILFSWRSAERHVNLTLQDRFPKLCPPEDSQMALDFSPRLFFPFLLWTHSCSASLGETHFPGPHQADELNMVPLGTLKHADKLSPISFYYSQNETCLHSTPPESCLPMLLGQAEDFGLWLCILKWPSSALAWEHEQLRDPARHWLGATFLSTSAHRSTVYVPWSCPHPRARPKFERKPRLTKNIQDNLHQNSLN